MEMLAYCLFDGRSPEGKTSGGRGPEREVEGDETSSVGEGVKRRCGTSAAMLAVLFERPLDAVHPGLAIA
jgi:hypothetical protein